MRPGEMHRPFRLRVWRGLFGVKRALSADSPLSLFPFQHSGSPLQCRSLHHPHSPVVPTDCSAPFMRPFFFFFLFLSFLPHDCTSSPPPPQNFLLYIPSYLDAPSSCPFIIRCSKSMCRHARFRLTEKLNLPLPCFENVFSDLSVSSL